MRRTLTMSLLLCGTFALAGVAHGADAYDAAAEHRAAGLTAYWQLHFHEAQGHFQAAVDADPENAAGFFYLGYTVYKIAEPKRPNDPGKHQAADLFARAYELDPGFTPTWGIRTRSR
jgi:tetratricopeptide (TPR) repeat protein